MRKSLFVLAAGVALAAVVVSPASAEDTTTTFTLSAGTLAITVPATANLGTVASGSASVSSQLGAVTVTDERAALNAAWTTSVVSSTFTTGGATAPETIATTAVNYSSGTATATTGTATFTPGTPNDLSVSRTAFSASAGTGNNSATWNPTVTVTIPAQAVAGTYTGTVTHSVA